jgi:hypothetical protein
MSLVVAVVVSPDADTSLSALVGWAHQSHVDSVVMVQKRGTVGQTTFDYSGVSIDMVAPSLQVPNSGATPATKRLAIKLATDGELWISSGTKLASCGEGDLSHLWHESVTERRSARGGDASFDEIDLDLWGR